MPEVFDRAGYQEGASGDNTVNKPEVGKVDVSLKTKLPVERQNVLNERLAVLRKGREKRKQLEKIEKLNLKEEPLVKFWLDLQKKSEDLEKMDISDKNEKANRSLLAQVQLAERTFKAQFVREFSKYDKWKESGRKIYEGKTAKFENIIDVLGLSEEDIDSMLIEAENDATQEDREATRKFNTPPEIPADSIDIQSRIEERKRDKTEVDSGVQNTRILHKGIDSVLDSGSMTADEEKTRRAELTADEQIAIQKAKIEAIAEKDALADKQIKSPDAGFRRSMSARDSQVLYDNLKKEDIDKTVKPSNEEFDEQMETAESVKAQKYADKLEKKAQRKGFFGKLLNKLFR